MAFWTFHISVFVNTTAMVVKSYTVLYMCMEVIICQSERSPERLMISQISSIGGTSNQLTWEKECGGNSPSLWGEFCKILPSQNFFKSTLQDYLQCPLTPYTPVRPLTPQPTPVQASSGQEW